MREWIVTHPRIAEAVFVGGWVVLTLAVLWGALKLERWWQVRSDSRRLVAEVEAALVEAAEARGMRAEGE